MTYRIEVDRTLCSGFGSCLQAAPSAFALDPGGAARPLAVLSDDPAVLEAAASCPMGAITASAEDRAA